MRNLETLLLLLVIGFLSCNKCKDYKSCDYANETNEYFSSYKEGNWWVYENQDNSKKDSVYVMSYNNYSLDQNKDKNFLSKKECIKYKQTDIKIHSNQIDTDNTIEFSYTTSPDHCNLSSLTIYTGAYTIYTISYDINSESFTNGIVNPIVTLKNNNVYNNVLSDTTNTYFFSKNTGLIRYIINADTFDLETYHIN